MNGGAPADAVGKDAKPQGAPASAAPKNVWAAFAQTDAAKREAQAQATGRETYFLQVSVQHPKAPE